MGDCTFGIGDACTPHHPWTLLLGGPSSEADVGLAFTPDFPCGVELNAAAAPTAPLRVLARWSGCIGGEPGCIAPGALAVITGMVAADFRSVVNGVELRFVDPTECSPSSAPRVKLRWQGCGLPGSVIFDSDSQIVVPAGPCVIDVLGPTPWRVMGVGSVESPTTWFDVSLRVLACPCTCWAPDGELTEWLPVALEDAVALRELVRPRRARKLAACFVNAPGGVIAGLVEWRHFPGGPAIGATTFAATTQQTADPWGASPYLSVTPAERGMAYLRWGLR